MASLVSGSESGEDRWHAFLKPAAAGSVHQAELPFIDSNAVTGAIAGAGISQKGVGTVALTQKAALDPLPDEERINRSEKRGRIVSVAPTAPPKAFNAGSVLERQSSLLRPTLPGEVKMTFVKAGKKGKEIEIAQIFYKKEISKPQKPKLAVDDRRIGRRQVRSRFPPTPMRRSSRTLRRNRRLTALLKLEPAKLASLGPVEPGGHSWAANPLPHRSIPPKSSAALRLASISKPAAKASRARPRWRRSSSTG